MLELAARSMFDSFARSAMGMLVVDRAHRVVWISDGCKRFLPALGRAESDFVGRRVEEVIPNPLMAQVINSGQPILVDLLANQAGTGLSIRSPGLPVTDQLPISVPVRFPALDARASGKRFEPMLRFPRCRGTRPDRPHFGGAS